MLGLGLGLWCLTHFSTIFISWRSVLLVEEPGIPRKNHQPDTSHMACMISVSILTFLIEKYIGQ